MCITIRVVYKYLITRLSHTFETAGMNKIINSIWFRYAHHVYMWQLIEFLLFLA